MNNIIFFVYNVISSSHRWSQRKKMDGIQWSKSSSTSPRSLQ